MNNSVSTSSLNKLRIDKWLWSARFFRTRSLAAKAVETGHALINGQRCKPSREIRPGDTLEIIREQTHMEVVVEGLSEKRGPAESARVLYRETPQSIQRRNDAEAKRRLAPAPLYETKERPTKRERRRLDLWERGH